MADDLYSILADESPNIRKVVVQCLSWAERAHTAEERVRALEAALQPFVDAFKKKDDPGVSDLYGEQPFHVTVLLGDCRRARRVLAARKEDE